MGYDQRRIEIVLDASRHNDERDRRDDALAEELREKIREIVESPQYEVLRPYVSWRSPRAADDQVRGGRECEPGSGERGAQPHELHRPRRTATLAAHVASAHR